jgi:hypothetical protein
MNMTLDKWQEMNQSALSAALAVVRSHLLCTVARAQDEASLLEATKRVEAAQESYLAVSSSASPPPAFETLCALFDLSPFERDILLLCAGMELDATFASACAAAQRDPQQAFPTFSLALAVLPQAYWSALKPDAPLRYWRLIEFTPTGGSCSAPLTTRPLRIDERVLHYLTGVEQLDERLMNLFEPVTPAQALMPAHQAISQRIAHLWSTAARQTLPPAILLYHSDGATARAIAANACAHLGLNIHSVNAHSLPSNSNDLSLLIRLWERESRLRPGAVLLDCDDDQPMEMGSESIVNDFIRRVPGALIISSQGRRKVNGRSATSFEAQRATSGEQRAVWEAALGNRAQRLDGQLDTLMSQFSLSLTGIYSAAADANVEQDSMWSFDGLWDACRSQTRPRLEELGHYIDSVAAWNDLVLPEAQKETLRDIVTHVRQRVKVYESWGFASKGSRGLGISALFAGASGTGKTMAAEVLARELRLDLYRIDLSSIVSKYIGETEKNLRRVFDAAEAGGAILLFDEADALFGKRSEVKDSHDRYANIEVSYLLQRMECYRGLAILTTNMRSALDVAFLRRIRFVVHFPFPDAAQRAEIWRHIFPSETPTEGLAVDHLSQLSVAGGNIRNIALNAAFLAAGAKEPVRMRHLLRAAQSEYAKLEKPLAEVEIAGWVQ